MDDVSLTVELGKISSQSGAMSFTLSIRPDGSEEVHVYAHDPRDRRKSGVFLILSQFQMRKLGDIVVKSQTASERFKSDGLEIPVAEALPATALIANDEAQQLFQKAREQTAAGDRESTVQTLQEIIRRFPTSRWAAKAQKTLSNAGL